MYIVILLLENTFLCFLPKKLKVNKFRTLWFYDLQHDTSVMWLQTRVEAFTSDILAWLNLNFIDSHPARGRCKPAVVLTWVTNKFYFLNSGFIFSSCVNLQVVVLTRAVFYILVLSLPFTTSFHCSPCSLFSHAWMWCGLLRNSSLKKDLLFTGSRSALKSTLT